MNEGVDYMCFSYFLLLAIDARHPCNGLVI